MPSPISNSPSSHTRLVNNTRTTLKVQLVLGAALTALVLFFGFLVWRVGQLSHLHQPIVNQQLARLPRAATPPREKTTEVETHSEDPLPPPLTALHNSSEKQVVLYTIRKEPAIDGPLNIPKGKTSDQFFEQRLQASEDDLRKQLREIPELRLLSDDDVKRVRKEVQEELQDLVNSTPQELQTKLKALRASRPSSAIGSSRFKQQRYDADTRLHDDMRRAAIQAGLELGSGPNCQLDFTTASEVEQLSKELRDNGFVKVPAAPLVIQNTQGGSVTVNPLGGRVVVSRSSSVSSSVTLFINGQRSRRAEERLIGFEAWCNQRDLENWSGAVPALTQMLQIEDERTRLLLVRELKRIKTKAATTELAIRAVADLSPAVRQAALASLEQRPSYEYLPVLLRSLRYPWSPVADHAGVALRTLKPQEAVAPLVDLVDLPSPSAPVYDAATRRYTVRDVVRLNHLRNCLLCHAPSANKNDGRVRGLVPTPGSPLPVQYYEGEDGDFVRADTTFLRQDFSINLPERDAAPWPNEQRYDFVTRLRTLSPAEVAKLPATSANYPQREAVLYALRGITGKNGGERSAQWREKLGFTVQAVKKPNDASPDKTNKQPKYAKGMLEKSVISPMDRNHER